MTNKEALWISVSWLSIQTGYGEYTGTVTVYDDATEIVTVRDEDDKTTWRGHLDQTSLLERSNSPIHI